MSKKEEKKGFHFVYVTEEDAKKELQEKIDNLTEDKKSEYQFEGQDLYKIGSGHDFVFGWYVEYVTKKGLQATMFHSGLWRIGGDDYDFKDNQFIKRPEGEHTPIDFSAIQFPIVKNVNAKTIADDIKGVEPKTFS